MSSELEELEQLVAGLPEPLRLVFTLRKVYELDHAAIAARMGITLERVDELLERAAIEIANALTFARLNVFQRALHKCGLFDLAEHRARAELDLSRPSRRR